MRVLHRSVTLLALAAAVTLIVSVVPAPAQAVGAAGGGGGKHAHPATAVRLSTAPVKDGAPDVVVGNAICLKNAPNTCVAMAPADWVNMVTGIIGAAGALVVIYKTFSSGGGGKHAKKFSKTGTANGGNQEGNGQCIGVWGYNTDAHLGSCNSKHGIWWTLSSHNGGYRLWNTYSKGDLIAPSNRSGYRLFAHSPEDWSTWAFEVCDGC